jgi:hypothetical protein
MLLQVEKQIVKHSNQQIYKLKPERDNQYRGCLFLYLLLITIIIIIHGLLKNFQKRHNPKEDYAFIN